MGEPVGFVLSAHAQKRLAQRKIRLEWIGLALASPDTLETDADDPELCHVLKAIPERGFAKLRVVYNETTEPWTVVTAFFT